jgi:hypothetical protein
MAHADFAAGRVNTALVARMIEEMASGGTATSA